MKKILIVTLFFFVAIGTVLVNGLQQKQISTLKTQVTKLEAELEQSKVDGLQALELVKGSTWYWVAPGVVSSTMDGTGKRVNYNSGISQAFAELHRTATRNPAYPRKMYFTPNEQNSPFSICGGLLMVTDVE